MSDLRLSKNRKSKDPSKSKECINRIDKFKKYMQDHDISDISSYDHVLFEKITKINGEIPLEYILNRIDWSWNYNKIGSYINPVDFLYHSHDLQVKLLNKGIYGLSQNHYIPIKFILKNSYFDWEWACIASNNWTIQEYDLYTINWTNYYQNLSENKSILLEWNA